jgi:mannose-6-phosphate isomerase-like protein (cupin superfamily)
MAIPAHPRLRLCGTHKESVIAAQGRRDFLNYYDYGVTDATGGWMRLQVNEVKKGSSASTGWHVHECVGQLLLTVEGWSEISFEAGKSYRRPVGEGMFLPGNTPHNELALSENFTGIEITLPAAIRTVPCEAPVVNPALQGSGIGEPPMRATVGTKQEQERRRYRDGGFDVYDLGVGEATGNWMSAVVRTVASSAEPTDWCHSRSQGQVWYGLAGSMTFDFRDAESFELRAGDCLFVPGELERRFAGATRGFRALEVSVPAEGAKKLGLNPGGDHEHT